MLRMQGRGMANGDRDKAGGSVGWPEQMKSSEAERQTVEGWLSAMQAAWDR